MSAPAPLLSARGVKKTYRSGTTETVALRGVDFDLVAGEMVMVMGPSGNGKTTMLNCLSGLDDIDDGTVTVDGLDIGALTDRKRTEHRARRMGFIFQAFNLIPVFSAIENVELPMLLAGLADRSTRRHAEDLLDRVGLGHRRDHRPSELSGGEQQRVAIARALVTKPAIIWADEPTGNLDSHTAADVLDMLREVNSEGQAFVVVTHDHDIGTSGQRLVEVHDGQITYDGPPRP